MRHCCIRRASPPPAARDDKAITAWNTFRRLDPGRGRMAARSGRLPGRSPQHFSLHPRAIEHAERGGWSAAAPQLPAGEAKVDAFLDDWDGLVNGLIELHTATGDPRWLEEAIRLADGGGGALRRSQGGRLFVLDPRRRAAGGAVQGPRRQPDSRPGSRCWQWSCCGPHGSPARARRLAATGHPAGDALMSSDCVPCLRGAAVRARSVPLAARRSRGDHPRPRESRPPGALARGRAQRFSPDRRLCVPARERRAASCPARGQGCGRRTAHGVCLRAVRLPGAGYRSGAGHGAR